MSAENPTDFEKHLILFQGRLVLGPSGLPNAELHTMAESLIDDAWRLIDALRTAEANPLEERQAWDRYAAAGMLVMRRDGDPDEDSRPLTDLAEAQELADIMLAARRRKFGGAKRHPMEGAK